MKASRRRFLKAASATAAAITVSPHVTLWAQQGSGPVKLWGTFGDHRHAALDAPSWKPAAQSAENAITVAADAPKQELLGFGAAITEASAYELSRLPDAERANVMRDLFAPDAMALNVCRTCIGSSDYATKVYSLDESDKPDPDLKNFSLDHDKQFYLPILREARKQNPDLFLFSSPWSPPGWMKPNNSMLGGAMRRSSFGPYAQYFMKFLDGYKAEGVTINAVTVQNETDAEQEGRMSACLWAQEQEIEFVKSFLGPALRKAGMPTKIWVLDHNYNLWGRALDELSDPEAFDFIDGIAWHGYVGDPSAMTRVHDAFPTKSAYWTEGGPDITQPDYQTDWAKWADQFNGILNNWARCITAWNVALDEKGKPNVGPFPCGGLITIENGTRKITQSGQYWAFAHYSMHVKRGAKVLTTKSSQSNSKDSAVAHVAVRNPDGSFAVVVSNTGTAEKRASIVHQGNALDVTLPAGSVQTITWS